MFPTFTVIYDACVLYPFNVRDLLMHIATTGGLVQARWSQEILDECFRTIVANRPDLKLERLQRTRELMCSIVPNSVVTGHESLINGLRLPDANDRHVLAAAIRCGAQCIVTFNLKDFPDSVLSQYEIRAVHPDDFVLDLMSVNAGAVLEAFEKHVATHRQPAKTRTQVVEGLEASGLRQTGARLRELLRIF